MDVQATLLYRTMRPLDVAAMVEAVNAWFGAKEMALHHSPAAGDTHILLSNPTYHAVITVQHSKVAPGILAQAMQQPILLAKSFDYDDAVYAHKMHVSVTIGDGPMNVTPEVRAWMARMGKHRQETICPLDLKLCALNGIVQHLVSHDVPELVHWAQSDMVFTPEEVAEAADMLFPLPLAVCPVPVEGKGRYGLRLEGSDSFAGRTLVMEPAALPFDEVMGISMWLLSQRIEGALALEHGAALETPGFPTLYLRHEMPDATDPKGRIVITQTEPDRYALAPGVQVAPQQLQAARPAAAAPQPAPVPAPAPAQPVAPQFFLSDRITQPPAYAAPAAAVTNPAATPQPTATAAPEQAAVAQALHAEAQTAPAAQPAPAPAPTAPQATAAGHAGWSNGAKSSNPFAAAVQRAAPAAAAAAPRANDAGVADFHKVDVAAGLMAKPAAQQNAAAPGARPRLSPGNLLRALPSRAIAGVLAMFLVLAAGMTLAPRLMEKGTEVAARGGSLTVVAGPGIPGLPGSN